MLLSRVVLTPVGSELVPTMSMTAINWTNKTYIFSRTDAVISSNLLKMKTTITTYMRFELRLLMDIVYHCSDSNMHYYNRLLAFYFYYWLHVTIKTALHVYHNERYSTKTNTNMQQRIKLNLNNTYIFTWICYHGATCMYMHVCTCMYVPYNS